MTKMFSTSGARGLALAALTLFASAAFAQTAGKSEQVCKGAINAAMSPSEMVEWEQLAECHAEQLMARIRLKDPYAAHKRWNFRLKTEKSGHFARVFRRAMAGKLVQGLGVETSYPAYSFHKITVHIERGPRYGPARITTTATHADELVASYSSTHEVTAYDALFLAD